MTTEENSLKPEAFIFKNGRKFHNEHNSMYCLPADNEECDRLRYQHDAVRELFGGNIPQFIAPEIKPILEKKSKLLDLCCGTGIFLSEIATEFPSCDCIGLDMVDVFQRDENISNVSFRSGNILNGLPFEDNTFDVVTLNYGILAFTREQWYLVAKEIKRVLKDGGYFLSREPAKHISDSSFVNRAFKALNDQMIKQEQMQTNNTGELLSLILFETKFHEIGSIAKPIYLSSPETISKKYLYNTVHVFKGILSTLSKELQVDNLDKFVEEFTLHLKESNTAWQVVVTYGRKPIQHIS